MTRPPGSPGSPGPPNSSESRNNPIDSLEALLGEALAPNMPSDDLAARIIANTACDKSEMAEAAPKLKLVGQQDQIQEPGDQVLVPLLDEALSPSPVPEVLVQRIVAATAPISDQIIARIGPLRVRYATAHRFAALVVVTAMLGIVVQSWGIYTDAHQIVQATRHVSSMMQYTAADTILDQEIDQLSSEIDQLTLGTNSENWDLQVDAMSQSLIGLEELIESETSGKWF